MSGSTPNFLVISVAPKSQNKTARYLERVGLPYTVLLPNTVGDKIVEGYGESADVYDARKYAKCVDFCGSNLKNGCAVAREAATDYTKSVGGWSVVLDDDYSGLWSTAPNNHQMNAKEIIAMCVALRNLEANWGIELGGYSGGAYPARKNNIMNVFFVGQDTPGGKYRMIFNEDVCSSIESWQHGRACFGMGQLIRSGGQTAEGVKGTGNIEFYKDDKSYRKSFGSVLQDPLNAKIEQNHNNKNTFLWHHKIHWANICPKIMLE